MKRAFALAYSRSPEQAEMDLALAYLKAQDTEDDANQLTRWERYCQVLLGANEFMYLD